MKKSVAFIGAGGMVAEKSIPLLAEYYAIVGVGGRRKNLSSHCTDFYSTDLPEDFSSTFRALFDGRVFDALVWNPVTYVPRALLDTTRETLHSEFDMAIALPLECLRTALVHQALSSGAPFIITSSQLAFGHKPRWASYSIVKRGQVMLAEYLAREVGDMVTPRCILFGDVPHTDPKICAGAFAEAIENQDREQRLYRVDTDAWHTVAAPH
jgi:NAD(P)-dependent dehydrogenase (short-subunit alcohol dehydrogenase family)